MDEKIFLKYGFNKQRGFENEWMYNLRIGEVTFLHVEIETGFVAIVRKKERNLKEKWVKILIPKPVRIEVDLSNLLNVMCI